MSRGISHYIFIYELSKTDEFDYYPEELEQEITNHLAILLAYHKSCDELIPISNTVVFGSPDSLQEICNNIKSYFRKHTDFALARIQPLQEMDTGYKPRSNSANNRDKRERLRNLIREYKLIPPSELLEKLSKWNS